jgi:hypothetical protein
MSDMTGSAVMAPAPLETFTKHRQQQQQQQQQQQEQQQLSLLLLTGAEDGGSKSHVRRTPENQACLRK